VERLAAFPICGVGNRGLGPWRLSDVCVPVPRKLSLAGELVSFGSLVLISRDGGVEVTLEMKRRGIAGDSGGASFGVDIGQFCLYGFSLK
jgi:hypothetical protein